VSSTDKAPIGVNAESFVKWASDPEESGRFFLSLDLSPETNALLEDLARKIHGTKGEVLRKAVGLFKLAMDAREQGKRVGTVGPDEDLETEFVGF